MNATAYETIQYEIEKEAGIVLGYHLTLEDLQSELAAYLNKLIMRDFEKLIYILYRVDVSESKIKQLLQPSSNNDAGELMAKAIIERQLQKAESRKIFTKQNDVAEEEKW